VGSERPAPRRAGFVDRRRLLVGMGFTAANVAVVRALPPLPSQTSGAGRRRAGVAAEPASVEGALEPLAPDHVHDVVVAGGRVMDPASGFDGTADVGIDGGTITAIRPLPGDRLQGRTDIDADGLVVAPGFVDILSYDPNPVGSWLKVADGVTTNLGMHGINADPEPWLARWSAEGCPVHFGGAFDDPWARARLGIQPDQAATPEQVGQLAAEAEAALHAGWLGIDVEPEYTPGIDAAEIDALGRVAAAAGVPVFFHGRYSDVEPPGTNADTLAEIVGTARRTGAAVHVEHIVSTGGTFSMEQSLRTLEAATEEGLDVTACAYPYDSWAAYLGSPRFAAGWQERFRIGYGDLRLPGGEPVTARNFRRYRSENRLAVAAAIPEDDVRRALAHPLVMVGSDSIIEADAQNHPRGAGTFARVLGRYVRDQGLLSLMDALAKMTWHPVARLEAAAPALRRKGRLQLGADADVTVFDPATVTDRATVEDPAQPSAGVEWVLVAGRVVKSPAGLRRDELPGQALRWQG
jgi:hypothetical protein